MPEQTPAISGDKTEFRSALEHTINCHSMENGSNTPDFVLSQYLSDSPGMNVLPCEVQGGKAAFAGQAISADNAKNYKGSGQKLEIGIRPEFVSFAKAGIPAEVVKVADAGRFRIVETRSAGSAIKLLVPEDKPVPTGKVNLAFDKVHTQIYADGWIV